jgi:hypothetical protein
MMTNCAYHSVNTAVVACNGCGRPLCSACDHRIKGFPFCQDCIVSGIQLLREQRERAHQPNAQRKTSPFVATILSLILPGLGAAYSGQTTKALVYFGMFVGLFQLALISSGMPIFVVGFFGIWLYSAIDSWRCAKLIRAGQIPTGSEEVFIQKLAESPKIWGFALASLGALIFIQQFYSIRQFVRTFLPVALILLGAYFLWRYVLGRGSARQASSTLTFDSHDFSSRFGNTSYRPGELSQAGDAVRKHLDSGRH